ncbi:hypothetical protein PILCRDRAFT_820193 [Piloderma croceum F 1598]|uniref:G domain-containing protein n=1 Tax=Piloderma croceum (strain F 1598) TaxID=765440 RepID=A0A0C3FT47_PILCF|nr:hypothetical protein PILCRDRAFT_820193 [Piloderma croceum F 1598]
MSQRDPQQVSTEDRIVAVMGPTGAGKSTFIDRATRQDGGTIGHGLRSFTNDIRIVRVNHPTDGRPVVLVDTPGFDDTYKSDTDILAMIAAWLVKNYKSKFNLTTILYLHDITSSRMKGSTLKNLRIFGTLCGQKAMPNVILVTTKWKNITIEEGVQRETELEADFWKDMINAGCVTARFEGTYESAWSIIGSLRGKHQATVLLPSEIVDSNLRLNETQAGIALNKELQQLIKSQKETARMLQGLAKNKESGLAVQELDKQQAKIEAKIEQTEDQLRKMTIPFTRRVVLFFKGRG